MFDARKSIIDWNSKCGNVPPKPYSPEYWEKLRGQAKHLVEEVNELIAAIDSEDAIETLDAQCDIDYVLGGLIFLSQHDHEEALKLVCENNDHKFTDCYTEALKRLADIEKRTKEECKVVGSIVDGKEYYCVRRVSDGKVMKQSNLPPLDISEQVVQNPTEEIYVVTSETCIICKNLVNEFVSLGVKEVTELKPILSRADRDFCKDNDLWLADIAYFDGEKLHVTSYPALGYNAVNLKNWLKGVGYNGFTEH